ncbi:MAG TPA: DUF2330 domain-containing protein [Kofleriaceae bacterium]|nr:DUF2330 domain-containing protein [Kofleriaceae bacterium]
MKSVALKSAIVAGTAAAIVAASPAARAFCGFYVSGSDKKMFNDATNVVLMRSGTRTVLSMQNDYRGPLEDFAMVVPVPVVLKEGDVRVLPKAVFDRLDSLGSPRLVEYWEQDPCPAPEPPERPMMVKPAEMQRRPVMKSAPPSAAMRASDMGADDEKSQRRAIPPVLASFSAYPPSITAGQATDITWSFQYANEPWPEPTCTVDHGVGRVQAGAARPLTLTDSTMFTLTCANSAGRATKQAQINVVTIEAKFDVAEYQILILSAKEATGLEQWLKLNNYKIPDDAAPLLRPYIEAGSKFFVARVDPKKVQMVDGRVALSPLRFHYDSEEFSLPIRLGLANSSGKQDLIVNILSPDRRYEVANYKNVMIPTNFDVRPGVRDRFAEFYAALFDKTVEANPGAVITEYAWTALPTTQRGGRGAKCDPCPPVIPEDADMITLGGDIIGGTIRQGGYVLTRLHARYGKKDMKDDLRFREAKPITGGREVYGKAGIEYSAQPASQNNFQARYVIRHWWAGPIKCANPRRAVWGGPPDGGASQVIAASKTAFAPRGKLQLASMLTRDLWEIGYKRASAAPPPAKPAQPAPAPAPTTKPTPPGPSTTPKKMWFGGGALAALLLLGLGSQLARRRRA